MDNVREAEASLAKAFQLQRQLADEFPDKSEYRGELALTYVQQSQWWRPKTLPGRSSAYDEAIRLEVNWPMSPSTN